MFYRNNNKKDSFVNMTIEGYNLVIAEKDKIIENISTELDDLKEKYNKINTVLKLFLNKYNFNGFNDISNFLDKYFAFLKKYNFKDFEDIILFVNKFQEKENVDVNNNNSQNNEYECKNECCPDIVNKPDTYCEDCVLYVKICKYCEKEFSDGYSNSKKCFECRTDSDNESDEDDNESEEEIKSDSSISDDGNDEKINDFGNINIKDNEKCKKAEIKINNTNTEDENKKKNKLEHIVNNLNNNIVDEKLPRKDKNKINVNDIFIEIKENKEVNTNINYNNEIFNNIKNISIKRIEKYKLMIELYEKLKLLEIDKPIKFKKYLKENNADDCIFIPIESKSRRMFNKCKKLYIINNYVKIETLLCLKNIDKIFTLKNKEFDELIYLLSQK